MTTLQDLPEDFRLAVEECARLLQTAKIPLQQPSYLQPKIVFGLGLPGYTVCLLKEQFDKDPNVLTEMAITSYQSGFTSIKFESTTWIRR